MPYRYYSINREHSNYEIVPYQKYGMVWNTGSTVSKALWYSMTELGDGTLGALE